MTDTTQVTDQQYLLFRDIFDMYQQIAQSYWYDHPEELSLRMDSYDHMIANDELHEIHRRQKRRIIGHMSEYALAAKLELAQSFLTLQLTSELELHERSYIIKHILYSAIQQLETMIIADAIHECNSIRGHRSSNDISSSPVRTTVVSLLQDNKDAYLSSFGKEHALSYEWMVDALQQRG